MRGTENHHRLTITVAHKLLGVTMARFNNFGKMHHVAQEADISQACGTRMHPAIPHPALLEAEICPTFWIRTLSEALGWFEIAVVYTNAA